MRPEEQFLMLDGPSSLSRSLTACITCQQFRPIRRPGVARPGNSHTAFTGTYLYIDTNKKFRPELHFLYPAHIPILCLNNIFGGRYLPGDSKQAENAAENTHILA